MCTCTLNNASATGSLCTLQSFRIILNWNIVKLHKSVDLRPIWKYSVIDIFTNILMKI
jgi:hypothetical protein